MSQCPKCPIQPILCNTYSESILQELQYLGRRSQEVLEYRCEVCVESWLHLFDVVKFVWAKHLTMWEQLLLKSEVMHQLQWVDKERVIKKHINIVQCNMYTCTRMKYTCLSKHVNVQVHTCTCILYIYFAILYTMYMYIHVHIYLYLLVPYSCLVYCLHVLVLW